MFSDLGATDDFNTINKAGMYYALSGTPGTPEDRAGYIGVSFRSGTRRGELAFRNGIGTGLYARNYSTGASQYGDWERLLTSADIQYGIVTVNAAQNETTEFSVTFPRQFSSTPQVVVTVATSGPKDNIASVLSITPNGFMGYLYRGGVTANMSIRWIAIGY